MIYLLCIVQYFKNFVLLRKRLSSSCGVLKFLEANSRTNLMVRNYWSEPGLQLYAKASMDFLKIDDSPLVRFIVEGWLPVVYLQNLTVVVGGVVCNKLARALGRMAMLDILKYVKNKKCKCFEANYLVSSAKIRRCSLSLTSLKMLFLTFST